MDELPWEDFARKVLAGAAPPHRVRGVVTQIIGDEIRIGPLAVGPGGVGSAMVVGTPTTMNFGWLEGDPDWDMIITVCLQLEVCVDLATRSAKYEVHVRVRTRIKLRLEQPCTVVVDVEEVRSSDVEATVDPAGIPSRFVGWVGNIDATIDEQVVDYFNSLVASPAVTAALRIDVTALLDRAWDADLVVSVPSMNKVQ